MADELISALTKLPSLRVLTCVRPLDRQERAEDVRQMAEGFEVATIVEGSVRKSGDSLRITVHLPDTVTGAYLWSETFDSRTEQVFAVQTEISHAIVEKLRGQISDRGDFRLSSHSTTNVKAYNLYLKGRYHLNQRSEKGLRKAAEYFERATHEHPEYPQAFAGSADSYSLLAKYGVMPPLEVWTKASAAATRAVLLDDHLSEAHASLAHVKATHAWDWADAEKEFQKAISLNARYATAHHWHGAARLAPMARLGEAVEEMNLAQALDPVSPIISRDAAVVFFYRRDYVFRSLLLFRNVLPRVPALRYFVRASISVLRRVNATEAACCYFQILLDFLIVVCEKSRYHMPTLINSAGV